MRGSGRFVPPEVVVASFLSVSIPFIAGQWSLLGLDFRLDFGLASFNPLHCGAVVASSSWAIIELPMFGSFNPLHCGAVVASLGRTQSSFVSFVVSIPFIAGQWSLLFNSACHHSLQRMFQSPSLRGSGRFLHADLPHRRKTKVSIPFIAGQWSLPARRPAGALARGVVSIPFIAGQWSLPIDVSSIRIEALDRFNPLHCGAVVASSRCVQYSVSFRRVSIPFIAVQWSLLRARCAGRD